MAIFPVQAKWMTWTGRVFAFVVIFMMLFSAYMKLSQNPQAVDGFAKAGYPAGALNAIGITEVICVLLFAIPKTRYFGGVLIAAYLGGAVCHHVRSGEPFWGPILFGVFAWLSLWLRDPRFRALAPLVDD